MITMISCPNFENPILKTGENPFTASPTADFAAIFGAPVCELATNIIAPIADVSANNDFQNSGEIKETENLPDALQLKTETESAQLRVVTASPETQLPQVFPSMIITNQPKPDTQPIDNAGLIDQTEILIKKDFEMNPMTVLKLDEKIENFDFSPLNTLKSEIVETKENPVELLKTKIARTNEQTNEQIKETNEFSNDLPNFFVAISKVFQAENNLNTEPETQTADIENYSAQNIPQPIFSSQIERDFQPENNSDNKAENNAFVSVEAETIVNQGIESGLIEILESPQKVEINSLTPFDLSEPAILQKGEKDEVSNRLPDFFTAMAKIFKGENFVVPAKSDVSVDFNLASNVSGESQTVGNVELNFAENGAMNLGQPEKILPEAESLPPDSGEVSPLNFSKFAANLSKETASAENSAQVPFKTREVLSQVEPQMIYLASLTVKENEKKVMKMRLHPAELGMVEITLERGSSGNLTANFQTESEATRQILTESINELRQSLEDSGWQIERLEIMCAAFSSNEKHEGERGRQAREFQNAENQPDGTVLLDNQSDSNADDKNDFKRNKSNRFVSLRA